MLDDGGRECPKMSKIAWRHLWTTPKHLKKCTSLQELTLSNRNLLLKIIVTSFYRNFGCLVWRGPNPNTQTYFSTCMLSCYLKKSLWTSSSCVPFQLEYMRADPSMVCTLFPKSSFEIVWRLFILSNISQHTWVQGSHHP